MKPRNLAEWHYIAGTLACIAVIAGVLAFSALDARTPDTMTPQQIQQAAQTAREAGQYPTN
jgi:hypothetical protein